MYSAVCIVTFALALSFSSFALNVFATTKLSGQTKTFEIHAKMVKHAIGFLQYEFVPRNMISKLQHGGQTPIQYCDRIGIMIVDICNIDDLRDHLSIEEFTQNMDLYYQIVEDGVQTFNLTKFAILGDTMKICSGFGEQHGTEHTTEMAMAACNMHKDINEFNKTQGGHNVHLRIGIHFGSCYARVIGLALSRIVIMGSLVPQAALIHASCLRSSTLKFFFHFLFLIAPLIF